MRLLVLSVALLALAPGCIVREAAKDGVIVTGEVDGSSATNTYYKLYLKDAEGEVAIANFDRRDWYVTGIEREVSNRELLAASVRGAERGVLNEVIVLGVVTPDDLNEFLYENMEQRAVADGRSFDRAALDREWDARLQELATRPPVLEVPLP